MLEIEGLGMDWCEATTFGDLLVRSAEKYGSKEAVVVQDDRRSFEGLLESAVQAGRSLLGLGVGRGDAVGILMPNCIDFVEVMFGGALIGARVVPINARFKDRELAYLIENADLTTLLTSDIVDQHTDYVEILDSCLPGLSVASDPTALELDVAPKLKSVVMIGNSSPAGMVDRERFEASAGSVPEEDVHRLRSRIAIRDIAMMMYTSGTTADPKGCPTTHEALVRTAVTGCRNCFELTTEDRFWDPLPLFHMSAILPLIGCIDAGSTYITLTHVEPGAAIRQLRDEACTFSFSTFPTVTNAILDHPDWDSREFTRIRAWNNVSSPDGLRELHKRLPDSRHLNAYGCTEIGGVACFTRPDDPPETWATTSGRPFDGIEIEIRDIETGQPVGNGERGSIWSRGYNLFEGYYKDEAKNAESFDDDGWFCTGDIGALDPEGRVSYLGRVKDMLKVGGENVAAVEIESLLQTHPSVSIAQVIAVPDAKYVEVPAAYVELRPDCEATEKEVIDYCDGKIARFKIPRYVRFISASEWPMSATKIQKFRLQDRFAEEQHTGSG